MGTVKKSLYLLFIIATELLFLKNWALCKNFSGLPLFSLSNLEIELLGDIHNDANIPFFLIRFFHNKPVIFLFDTTKQYFQYWNIQLFISIFSFVGLFGIIFWFWNRLQQKKGKTTYIVLAFLLSIPLFEFFLPDTLPFLFRLLIFVMPYFLISLFGWSQFLDAQKSSLRQIFLILLIVLSLWWIWVFHYVSANFCSIVKIAQ